MIRLIGWLCFLVLFVSGAAANGERSASVHYLLMSDIHFDPFSNARLVPALEHTPADRWDTLFTRVAQEPTSGITHDTNAPLWLAALANMQHTTPHPKVILVAGDFLAHNFHRMFMLTASDRSNVAYERFVDKTVAYIALSLHTVFPSAQIIPTIGNNDAYCGDYASTPESPFLKHMATVWETLVEKDHVMPDFIANFSHGGYFTTQIAGTDIRVISLNSVLWSARYDNECDIGTRLPGRDEMRWLHEQLAHGEQHTWLLTHIPPGIDIFTTRLLRGAPISYWQPTALAHFLQMLSDSHTKIDVMLAGHMHDHTFRIANDETEHPLPILVIPAISPVFGNEPAYLDADVDEKHARIMNFTEYRLPQGLLGTTDPHTWDRAYNFAQDCHLDDGFSTLTIHAVYQRLQTNKRIRDIYEDVYDSRQFLREIDATSRPAYRCGEINMSVASYERCINQAR